MGKMKELEELLSIIKKKVDHYSDAIWINPEAREKQRQKILDELKEAENIIKSALDAL
jgi:vacuolar-type H+-ATPase subunit H